MCIGLSWFGLIKALYKQHNYYNYLHACADLCNKCFRFFGFVDLLIFIHSFLLSVHKYLSFF